MEIIDRVYGRQEIRETVLIELVRSRPLARLKGINQAGVSKYLNLRKDVTRFEHSVGVMLLLRKFQASIVEQIAGLLHDVPHTAFSHAADFVFKRGEIGTFHESFLRQIVFASEIPNILTKHGFDPERVIDEHNFTPLEQNIPKLCADRIDYSLRDISSDNIFSSKDVNDILQALTTHKGRFVMTDEKVAYFYAKAFMDQCLNSWNSPQTLAAFELFGQMVRRALEVKVLNEQDLFLTDDEVIEK